MIKCEICGFSRYVEKCHIIPKRLGGGRKIINTVVLCPTHHKLLDYGLLNNEEIFMIENKIINLCNNDSVRKNMKQLEYLYSLLETDRNITPKTLIDEITPYF